MPYADPLVKRAKQAEYRAKNRAALVAKETERQAIKKAADPDAFLAKQREWRLKRAADGRIDREAERRRCQEYRETKRSDPSFRRKEVQRVVAWQRANPTRVQDNIQMRLARNLRGRLNKAIKRGGAGVSAVRHLGMSIPAFRDYIASLFKPGMSWDNYGEWHLDHVRPLALFDLTDAGQARAACHYTNLQPLWAIDNQRKHCKPHYALAMQEVAL